MGKDYYSILGVAKDADADTLKKNYRKLAAKYHPDKVRGSDADKAAATEKFKEVGEAYDVLSDPDKRAVYDRFGEEGLKGGVPPSAAADAGGAGPGAGFRGGYNFDAGMAEKLFQQFFGGMGGMGGLGGMGGGGGGPSRVRMFSSTGGGPGGGAFSFFSNGGPAGMAGMHMGGDSDEEMPDVSGMRDGGFPGGGFGGRGGFPGAGGMRGAAAAPKQQVVELALPLEQLYTGTTKKLRVTRRLHDAASGGTVPVQEVVQLDVKPGWKEGTRVTFEGKGDELPGRPAADLVFIIKEQPHTRFTRKGNDLVTTVKVPLVTALTGGQVAVPHLDGRTLSLNISQIVTPGSERVIRGEGMPISKAPGTKGDLRVVMEVVFPKSLTEQQRSTLRSVLPVS